MAEKRWELAHITRITPGLWTGDPLEVVIEWEVKCTGTLCYGWWRTRIHATANGYSLEKAIILNSIGGWGGQTSTLKFHGTMPPHDVTIHLWMENSMPLPGVAVEIIERDFTLPNLSGVSPEPDPLDGIPPGFCVEGDTRCATAADIAAGADPTDLMVCSNARWVLKEKNVLECGYVPEECFEGTTRCIGTTLQRCVDGRWKTTKTNALECGYVPPEDGDLPPGPPEDESKLEKFWREYKWWIIGGLAIIAVAVLIIFPPKGIHLPRRGK